MGIEGGIVGGSAGGAPISMELLQLIAADPAEFQRRMALIEQSKKDFDEQLEKNQIVGDILALRKESSDAVNSANAALESAKKAAATLLSDAKSKADKLLAVAAEKADKIIEGAVEAAEEEKRLADTILKQAQDKAEGLAGREKAAATLMKDADKKYKSVEPDRKKFQMETAAAQAATEAAEKAKADYEAKIAELDAAAKQIAKVLGGG